MSGCTDRSRVRPGRKKRWIHACQCEESPGGSPWGSGVGVERRSEVGRKAAIHGGSMREGEYGLTRSLKASRRCCRRRLAVGVGGEASMARSGSRLPWGARRARERLRASGGGGGGGEMRPFGQGSGGQGGCPNGGWGSRSVGAVNAESSVPTRRMGRREHGEAPVCFFEVADRQAMGKTALSLFALVLPVATVASGGSTAVSPATKEEVQSFQRWVAMYGRSFATAEEMKRRLDVYRTNVQYIESFNNNSMAAGRTYYLGEGPFTDLTDQEFAAQFTLTGMLPQQLPAACSHPVNVTTNEVGSAAPPSRVDWREAGAVTPVKTQGHCGTCRSTNLSHYAARITDYEYVPSCSEKDLMAAVAKQPVAVEIDLHGIQHYKGGIFNGPCGVNPNHFVTVVGYNQDSSGTNYWIARNSWGKIWGDQGCVLFRKDVEDQPLGMCGLAISPVYPIM
ncbi:hypothetical protein PR202_ga08012 [Eleusine coracana subsp. coracana]|uniref:Uncharacterized protein n=1 Tax=Eleusine coracana subsp. coracana TaxID=191504 RepID=A0AAV5C1G6_ELECO|nr:hypothetical protein PR202_ga08012 [Eleusine coracana subsp. coracana]